MQEIVTSITQFAYSLLKLSCHPALCCLCMLPTFTKVCSDIYVPGTGRNAALPIYPRDEGTIAEQPRFEPRTEVTGRNGQRRARDSR